MALRRQILANRRNAQKSTGPRTAAGKLRSKRNATKHGLTAETVITVFESAADYEAFERAILSQHRARSATEQHLIVRLASLLWRLRRATAIETGLFSIQAEILQDRKTRSAHENASAAHSKAKLYEVLGIGQNENSLNEDKRLNSSDRDAGVQHQRPNVPCAPQPTSSVTLYAQCFLRVARLDHQILERLSRYEATLWRQATKIAAQLGIGRTIS
jgi:hypothetical protein